MTNSSEGSSVGEAVSSAQEQVQDKAQDMQQQASDRLRQQVDTRSTQVGEQTTALAGALRRAGEQLEQNGNGQPARLVRQASQQLERVGGYLRDSNADRILGGVEDFARSRPWVAGGIGALAGFVGSRFLKASSGRRYEQQRQLGQSAPQGTRVGMIAAQTYAGPDGEYEREPVAAGAPLPGGVEGSA
jgi:ElaB/YqjD/DUF883 family membrane-anchored ribosome-binding protein